METELLEAKGAKGPEPRRRVEPRQVHVLAAVTVAAAVLVLALGVVLGPREFSQIDLRLLPWVPLVAVATLATISFGEGRPALSMDLPILLACGFAIGPVPAGVVAAVAAWDCEEIRRRIPLSRALFNHAQTCLSVIAAASVFLALGGRSAPWPAVVPIALAAVIADIVVNVMAVVLITAISDQTPMLDVLRESIPGSPFSFAAMYAGFGFMGLLIYEVYSSSGYAGAIACMAPVLIAREAFRHRARIHVLSGEARRRNEALRAVDQRIAQERKDERDRIAEALHDDLLQSLYTVSLNGHVIGQDYRTGQLLELEGDVPRLVQACEHAVEQARNIIASLRRSPVGHAGLVGTLELFIGHLRDQFGTNFVPDVDATLRLEPALELVIYQVAREALMNAARYAQADTIWVQLRRRCDEVTLSVVDNGAGFGLAERQKEGHFGLTLMRERAEGAGGGVEVRSQPDSGTCVEAWFPVKR